MGKKHVVKKILFIFKVWLLMLTSYLLTSLLFDYVYYRVIDLRQAAMFKLIFYPPAFTVAALWLLRRKTGTVSIPMEKDLSAPE